MTAQEIYANTVAQKSKGRGNTGAFADNSQTIQQSKPVVQNKPKPKSNVQKFTDFGEAAIAGNARGMKAIFGFVGNTAKNTFEGIKDFADPVAKVATGWYEQDQKQVDLLNKTNEARLDKVFTDYKAGRLTKDQYQQQLQDISKERNQISTQVDKNMSVIRADKDRVIEGAINTAITIVSVGSYAGVGTSLKAGAGIQKASFFKGAGFTNAILTSRGGAAFIKAEELIAKIPSVRALLARNGAKFANTSRGVINQSIRDAVVGAFIKEPFMYHSTIDDVRSIYKDINEGELNMGTLGRVAFTVTLAFDGGILGAGGKMFKYGQDKLALATLGRGSMLDDLSKRFKDSNPRSWVNWIDEAVDETDKLERVKYLKITQEMNLQRWGDSTNAVEAIAYHMSANGSIDIGQKTFGEFMDGQVKYLKNYERIEDLASRGKITDSLGNVIGPGKLALGTFDQTARQNLIDTMQNMTYMQRVQHIESSTEFWAQNSIMRNKLLKAVHDAETKGSDFSKAIQSIDTAENLSKYLPKQIAKEMAKDGYVLIAPVKNLSKFIPEQSTRELVTDNIINGIDTVGTVSVVPVLNNFHGILAKAGLSTQAANDVAYKQLYSTVTANMNDLPVITQIMDQSVTKQLNVTASGKFVLDTLQEFATNKAPVLNIGMVNAISDIRQLRIGEIVEAMANKGIRISKVDAKDISNAIVDSYKELPLQLRGLGDRFVDNMFKYVPGFSKYNRLQSALRYTYNPFFRVQEVTETAILSRMSSGNLIWGKGLQALEDTATKLDNARLFNTGFSGAGARDDVVLGRITANISRQQKRDLAGMAMKLADKRGITIDKMITDHFDELEDALKVVVQYPSKGIISSPLARTLNLAFFPTRYNLKVTGLVAKSLAKQPPVVQYAVINGIMDASNWLKTDEGIAWESENSEALGVLRWITPYGSIESVINMLNGSVDSVSDLGVLGGLPAGVIFQTLDSQGVFQNVPGPLKYQTPYVNPKTGEVYADKIPDSVKAKAAVALGDFINSVFTYPGRILGLPGKGEAIRGAVGTVLKTDKNEYEYVDVESKLTPLQKRKSDILKQKALDELTHDETLELYRTDGQWSTPNLASLVASPKIRQPKKKTKLGREV